MELMLDLNIIPPKKKIRHEHTFLLVGSCFSEEIGNMMKELKFSVLQNPNGILYDPLSISSSLLSYLNNNQYADEDLFYYNELWQSFQHHSSFSDTDKEDVLKNINTSQSIAHEYLKKADWLIITLGSAYNYRLVSTGQNVANCHKMPSGNFEKSLIKTDKILKALANTIEQLQSFNPHLNIIFTVSPVRHIKDGIIENNRSKARLIEAVHELKGQYKNVFYFPAYELIIDILRDYRFYKDDMVHPNSIAIEYVFEKFTGSFFEETSQQIIKEIRKIMAAKNHKPFNTGTNAYRSFKKSQLKKVIELQAMLPQINFSDEIKYFAE